MMHKTLLSVVGVGVALVLAGCASTKVMSASGETVVVRAMGANVAEAQQLADQECAKNNKRARLSMKANALQYVYDCVN